MAKAIFWILSFLISYTPSAEAKETNFDKSVQGQWLAKEDGSNLFEGSVRILSLKTKPESQTSEMLLIYDEQLRGFLCSEYNQEKSNIICSAVTVNKRDISSEDRADLVTNQLEEMIYFLVKLEKENNFLKIMGHHLTDAECINTDTCSFKLLSLLAKKQPVNHDL